MTPDELKDLKLILATFKFDITELIERKFKEILENKKERWKDEQIRRRERCW